MSVSVLSNSLVIFVHSAICFLANCRGLGLESRKSLSRQPGADKQ